MKSSLVFVLSLLFAATALSENNATIVAIAEGTALSSPGILGKLATASENDPHNVARMIEAILSKADLKALPDPLLPAPAIDFATNYYSVVFAAKADQVKDRQIFRFLIHGPKNREKVVDHLVGTKTFYEIFLAEDEDGAIETVVSAKPLPNPLEADIVKAAKLVTDAGVGLIGGSQKVLMKFGSNVKQQNPPPPKFALKILLRRIDVDDERATLNISTIILDRSAITGADLDKALNKTKNSLLESDARVSICAQDLATGLFNDADPILKMIDAGLVTKQHREKVAELMNKRIGEVKDQPICKDEFAKSDGIGRNQAVITVQNKMGGFFDDPEPLAGMSTLQVSPLQYVDLGVAVGAMERIRGARRVKLNDKDEFVPDPLEGVLMMAAAHWHPMGFDPLTATPTSAERASVLFGVVMKPAPGLAAGLSWSFFRGLSMHISHAWMRVDVEKDPKAPAMAGGRSTPSNLDDPFRHAWARAWTIGIGYNFE
jgi:hypothetical protein